MQIKCPNCKGAGGYVDAVDFHSYYETCPTCNGTGRITEYGHLQLFARPWERRQWFDRKPFPRCPWDEERPWYEKA